MSTKPTLTNVYEILKRVIVQLGEAYKESQKILMVDRTSNTLKAIKEMFRVIGILACSMKSEIEVFYYRGTSMEPEDMISVAKVELNRVLKDTLNIRTVRDVKKEIEEISFEDLLKELDDYINNK